MRHRAIQPAFNPHELAGYVAQRGFNLIEIMIAIAVLGIFMAIGLPAIGDWVQNRQVPLLAESIASGIRQAQSEAVQRNAQVDLVLTTSDVTNPTNPSTATLAAGGLTKTDITPNWMIRVAGDTTAAGFLQGKMGRDGSENARFAGPAGVRFSPLGRVAASIASNGTTTVPAGNLVFQIVNPSVQCGLATQRCVYVSTGGAVRVCDPRAPSGDGRACTPACVIPC